MGDLAIVLHSHMPYVEGFGTYPFGEEWLFDAYARSHLPVLEVARELTLTVTPVLADQLEAEGVADRLESFLAELRLGAATADLADLDPKFGPALRAQEDRYRGSLERIRAVGGDLLAPFREAQADGRVELMASAASHAVLPLLASVPGRRLQLDAGLRSHRRRFGEPGGFWLPECAYEPGLERLLAERDVACFCTDQSAHEEEPMEALSPVATPAGPVALPLDWEAVRWLWSPQGYPSDDAHADSFHESGRGFRVRSVAGATYDPGRAEERAREQAAEFVTAVAARLEAFRSERGRPGLVTFAIDTELLGHWWWEGPVWLAEVLRLASSEGVGLVTASRALERHPPVERPLARSSWGEGKDLRTWDSPAVADLVRGARRLELRLLRLLHDQVAERAGRRAARELLAVQASDWAFLDGRGEAGDYAYERATGHARAMLEAIHSSRPPDPRMRNLAPDLSLAPMLEP
jgi:1,4-alpha-glucan branching enzyme